MPAWPLSAGVLHDCIKVRHSARRQVRRELRDPYRPSGRTTISVPVLWSGVAWGRTSGELSRPGEGRRKNLQKLYRAGERMGVS